MGVKRRAFRNRAEPKPGC